MQAAASICRAVAAVPGTVANACPSSWINWICYWVAISAVRTPAVDREIVSGGPALYVLVAGLAMFFASVALIQRHMSLSLLANTFGKPSRLVTSGVFRYTRNPIYVAFLFPLASIGYVSPLVAVAAIAVYIAAMNVFLIRIEEALLEQTFGEEYRDYRRQTPRWIA